MPVPRGISGAGETLTHNLRHAAVASMTTFRYPNDPFLERCEDASVPSFSLVMPHQDDLWNEVLRWQVATALVGFLLDVNPFDEPDVAGAKDATLALLARSPENCSFRAWLDEEVLAEEGVTDLTKYRCDPDSEPEPWSIQWVDPDWSR